MAKQNTASACEDKREAKKDTPQPPHNMVVVGKTVVLVRHHYAETGDVEEIYNEYLDDKTGEK